MPRPKHPIAQHFRPVDKADRKGDAIQCRYCGKVKAAGNPTRCQQHLDSCQHFADFLANPNNSEPSELGASYTRAQTDGDESFNSSPVRTLTEGSIRASFEIGEEAYSQLLEVLETRMDNMGVFDPNLDTASYKKALHEAIEQTKNAFPNVFHELSSLEPDATRKLTSLSQVVHRRRRRDAIPLASPKAQNHAATNNAKGDTISVFGGTTIIAEREDGSRAFVVCRPIDLVHQDIDKKTATEVTIDDLSFARFVMLLERDEDVRYEDASDRIAHTFIGGRVKNVTNETVWRVALEEMHRKGDNPLVFKIKRVVS